MTVDYDEFGLFHENAAEFGIPYDGPPVVRRETVDVEPGRSLSALVWGDAEPQLFFLHGAAQNAHTFDTVALALDRPLVAVDLPGHGHSDGLADASDAATPAGHARDVVHALERLAPSAAAVVGMSLGGLTSIALADARPELVRRLVLVDITPGVTGDKAKAIANFVRGPATFDSFDDLLARTIEHNPTRTVDSLRRGILHNALQQDDGTWVWRYRRTAVDHDFDSVESAGESDAYHAALWDAVERSEMPLLLVRGMLSQSVVDDDDVAELLRRRPDAQVVEVPHAGHSVQGDAPLELASAIERFLADGL